MATYDAWGKVTSVTGTDAETVGKYNSLRYRGYYYDSETGYYYLQSRYYDPGYKRFINADDPTLITDLTKESVLGGNLFAYCGNNAINDSDDSGHFGVPTLPKLIAGAVIGGVLGALIDAVVQIYFERKSIKTLSWSSIAIEFVSGALTGALIACNLPTRSTSLGRGILGMLSSLAHSIRTGKFRTIKGAFIAIGQAIVSGATTIIIGTVKAKYGKTLNYNNVKEMIKKIAINRIVRGGIRLTIGFGSFKLRIVLG